MLQFTAYSIRQGECVAHIGPDIRLEFFEMPAEHSVPCGALLGSDGRDPVHDVDPVLIPALHVRTPCDRVAHSIVEHVEAPGNVSGAGIACNPQAGASPCPEVEVLDLIHPVLPVERHSDRARRHGLFYINSHRRNSIKAYLHNIPRMGKKKTGEYSRAARDTECGGNGDSSDELEMALDRLSYRALDDHCDNRSISGDEEGISMAVLEGKRKGQGRVIIHPGGFQEWRKYTENGAPRIRKKHMVSEKQAQEFSQKYNAYFYALTGKELDFVITPTSQPYLSMLEACRHRDQVLMTLFEEPPVIWELMGGSGSDSIAFMLDLAPKEMVIVEYGVGAEGEKVREKEALIHNIRSFCRCFEEYHEAFDEDNPGRPGKRVRVEYTTAKDFIQRANPPDPTTHKREPKHVNMVYLDPSWDKAFYQAVETEERRKGSGREYYREDEGEGEEEEYVPNTVEEYESTPEELFHYLQSQVWGPMKENNIHVDVYLLKTRWEWSRVQRQLEQVNSQYYIPYSIQAVPFRENLEGEHAGRYGELPGQFHWITMIHKNYRTIYDRRTKWYMDLIRHGKKVYVDERTTIKPFHPRYTDHIRFPTVYEEPHDHCFEVVPPDYGRKRGGAAQRLPRRPPSKGSKQPYQPPEDWREQREPQIPAPPENVWEKRRKEAEERRSRDEQGPGYRGRYDVLWPENEARLQTKRRL